MANTTTSAPRTARPPGEPYLLDPELQADPAAGYGKIGEQGPVVRG
ncbi:hypothetical protein [Streptomyces sp. NPDC050121]